MIIMGINFISIIIPTFNDWSRLRFCLDALSSQRYPSSLFEVIVVNNNPADDVPEGFANYHNVIILKEDKAGSYAARNKALEIAKGDVVGFTDSDTIPDSEWIRNAVAYFNANPGIFRIAGRIKLFYLSESPTSIELYDTLFAFRQKHYAEDLGFGVTANMFTYKRLFNEIGPFKSDLLSGGDFEWGRRANSKGYPIHYVESAFVMHPARNSYSELKRKIKRISGGHLLMKSDANRLDKHVYQLLKGLKPSLIDLTLIYRSTEISRIEKIVVFGIRYHLNILSNLEKIKILLGHKPERR
jgi:cellulose synthase/poly-beta-1,6-N-acetylglucosamine synthase-like glycosyltransferase